ncbi:hypothetical protein RIF29_25305 [Crotalaria pallida]|uniref:Uncharacterized protein n=1 Tax=Crotalaria pallida TaxID=3830 RepID=A0AAN9ELW7_CROPI
MNKMYRTLTTSAYAPSLKAIPTNTDVTTVFIVEFRVRREFHHRHSLLHELSLVAAALFSISTRLVQNRVRLTRFGPPPASSTHPKVQTRSGSLTTPAQV